MLLISQLVTAALFGAMLFFSFIMAPLIFIKLDEAVAGRFIRAVFPWYYLVLLSLSLLAGLLLSTVAPLEAGVMLGCGSMAALSRQVLMPRINRFRDRALSGDPAAERRFEQLHRLSVVINSVQLIGVTCVLVMLASS